MPDDSLLLLFDEVRGKTLGVLEEVTDRQARFAPPGLANTILWHAGHSYVVVEWLSGQATGRPPRIPDGWFEIFSWESRPAQVPADQWPPLAEVVAELQAQHQRLRSVIATFSAEQLAASVPDRPERTVRFHILHALHDEACHSGEIWLLRKLQIAGG